jgi:hypothetical protein
MQPTNQINIDMPWSQGHGPPPNPRRSLSGWALAVGLTLAVTATCSNNTINCNCGGRQTFGDESPDPRAGRRP